MTFKIKSIKGVSQYLLDVDVDFNTLRLHISEIAPGTSAHAPHTHAGVEAFYVLEGYGTIDVEGERHALGPNDAIILDPTKLHGLTNTGDTPMRYVVIITKCPSGAVG